MRKIILFFICIILQTFNADFCAAQNQPKIDSLLNVLKTAKEDTNKVHLLLKIAAQYMNVNPEPMLAYDEQALALSEKLNFTKGKFLSSNAIAIYYYFSNDFGKALEYAKKNIKLAEENNTTDQLFMAYNTIAGIYDAQGEFKLATPFRLKTLVMAEKLNEPGRIASSNHNIGINYESLGNYTDALTYYFKALKIREQKNDSLKLPNSYSAIGDVYSRMKDFENGKKFHFKSLAISEKTGDVREMISSYYRLGEISIDENKLDEAKKYFSESLAWCKKNNDLPMTAATYQGLGKVSDAEKKYDEAMNYYKTAFSMFVELGDKMGISDAARQIGIGYLKKNDIKKSLFYFQMSRETADSIGYKSSLVSVYKNLSETYEKIKNYKEAYKYSLLYKQLSDSVLNEETAGKTAEMNAKYESEKKESQIAILTKDKQIQKVEINRQKFIKTAFIIGLAVLLILSILFYNYYRTKQLLKLQTLRNRIASDLHDDVGSTLSSISIFSELAKEQSKEVIPMLESIGESSRKMLESMADIVWTINPENDNFEKIILRMRSFAYQLLGAKKIDFEFNADDTVTGIKLPMDVRKNLYLIFKEAVNNMVKYADADNAFFSVSGTKNNLTMLIRDNGKGFDTTQTSEGNGLKNMKKRAEEVGAKLLIESGADIGTTIQFLLKIA